MSDRVGVLFVKVKVGNGLSTSAPEAAPVGDALSQNAWKRLFFGSKIKAKCRIRQDNISIFPKISSFSLIKEGKTCLGKEFYLLLPLKNRE